MTFKPRPNTQVTVFLKLMEGSRILLSKRKNTGHYDGFYSLVAGKVEPGESLEEAMIREVKEEIGIEPFFLELVHVAHRKAENEEGDCLDFYFHLDDDSYVGEIVNKEPDKCGELIWALEYSLPYNTVPYVRSALGSISEGQLYDQYGWMRQKRRKYNKEEN